jgi:hypothetical protein
MNRRTLIKSTLSAALVPLVPAAAASIKTDADYREELKQSFLKLIATGGVTKFHIPGRSWKGPNKHSAMIAMTIEPVTVTLSEGALKYWDSPSTIIGLGLYSPQPMLPGCHKRGIEQLFQFLEGLPRFTSWKELVDAQQAMATIGALANR